jgi:hypothetical protein
VVSLLWHNLIKDEIKVKTRKSFMYSKLIKFKWLKNKLWGRLKFGKTERKIKP